MNAALEQGGLVYKGCLPLSIELLADAPAPHELLRANEGNELLLRSMSALEEKIDTEENDTIAQELRRQDMKLNLILDLMGSLLQQYQVIPHARELQLTASSVRIGIAPNPGPARHCRIQLYLEPAIPKALVLYGQCQAALEPGISEVVFSGLSQTVTDHLDKFIFRHHRRQIAQARKG